MSYIFIRSCPDFSSVERLFGP